MDIKNKIVVGNVIKIDNGKVTILMHKNTNVMTYFHNGKIYRGVSVGEYIGIIRGPLTIIAKIENEFLEDKFNNYTDHSYEKNRFERYIDVRIIGQFNNGDYEPGIKHFPLVYNEVILLNEIEISTIIEGSSNIENEKFTIKIGNTVQESLPYKIRWDKLFNTHIGIFGNTGSGKSNTLAKIYTELFNLNPQTLSLNKNSKFIFIDFNGEYMGKNVFISDKTKIDLNTRTNTGDRIKLKIKQFFNADTLSILYSATEKTQKPFIQNALNFYYKSLEDDDNQNIDLAYFISSAYYNVFRFNNHRESLNLLKRILKIIGYTNSSNEDYNKILSSEWFNHHTYRFKDKNNTDKYVDGDKIDIYELRSKFEDHLRHNNNEPSLSLSEKVKLIMYLQLIYGLSYNHVQFEHISPLISRIEGNSSFVDRIFEIVNDEEYMSNLNDESFITVISLRNCNLDAKKIVPLLIAKESYENHKESLEEQERTFHLVIDEAHNILSEEANREAESWKDYRLNVFEEIIKEGRKFGYYLTISTQRPFDVSPTIISQIHNFFLHRLVNENDIRMLNNTISTLDQLSKNRIPTLAPGQCIVTGTSFESPMLIDIDLLENESARPDSDNSNLVALWNLENNLIKISFENQLPVINEFIEDVILNEIYELWNSGYFEASQDIEEEILDTDYIDASIEDLEIIDVEYIEERTYQIKLDIFALAYFEVKVKDTSDPFGEALPTIINVEEELQAKGTLEVIVNDEDIEYNGDNSDDKFIISKYVNFNIHVE